MSYNAKVIKILVASPGDTVEARHAIWEVCHKWNSLHAESMKIMLQPIMWEHDSTPELGGTAQQLLNKQIVKSCDVLVATFWTRLGTPTNRAASGTVEEIYEFIDADKPVLLYFSTQPVKMASVDQSQWKALNSFKAEIENKGLLMQYDEIQSFKDQLHGHLLRTIRRVFTENKDKKVKNNFIKKTSAELFNQLLIYSSNIKREWDQERLGNPSDIEQGKEILSMLDGYLNTFIKRYTENLERSQTMQLVTIQDESKRLADTVLYLDGGKSMEKFWDQGNNLIKKLVTFSSN